MAMSSAVVAVGTTAVRAAYVNDDVFGALFVRIGATTWSWSYLDTDANVLDDGTKSLIGV